MPRASEHDISSRGLQVHFHPFEASRHVLQYLRPLVVKKVHLKTTASRQHHERGRDLSVLLPGLVIDLRTGQARRGDASATITIVLCRASKASRLVVPRSAMCSVFLFLLLALFAAYALAQSCSADGKSSPRP